MVYLHLPHLGRARRLGDRSVDRDVRLHDGLTAGAGERVVTRRNHRRLATSDGFMRNGALWDVTEVLPDGALRVRAAHADLDARSVRLPAEYVAEHVELGYATTIARTQGMTVEETHTIATQGMGREDLYVAMSRGRHTNRTYGVVLDDGDPDCLPGQKPSLVREALGQILATSHAELSATATWGAYHPGLSGHRRATRASTATVECRASTARAVPLAGHAVVVRQWTCARPLTSATPTQE